MSEIKQESEEHTFTDEPIMQHAVLSATYSDFKLIKTRQVISVSFEIPLENYELVHRVLGMPNPAEEMHVAIARLQYIAPN